ncbi:MAG: GNAT family N-acetyltransferase [Dysgonamonadaceae bacterium]|jgi:predicted acetyltransferase|nr:GNAT family N-acetyltransferase [Dysgonamonadaceae bacterium]
MITFASDRHKSALKAMWKICFPADDNEFIDFYFDSVYKNEETPVYLIEDKPVASLQILPYSFKINDETFTAAYLSGVMTHPACRKCGYMNDLIKFTIKTAFECGFDYSFLLPQEKWLFEFYEKFGFATCKQVESNVTLQLEKHTAWILEDFWDSGGVSLWTGMILRLNKNAPEIQSFKIPVQE